MAESSELTWEHDNVFIPKYVSQNLNWYEKDGLETWYRQIKCEEFLNNTGLHFAKKKKIVNFDIIKNKVDGSKLKQYKLIDHDKIKNYPLEFQNQIQSSTFRNADRKDMNISKETIKEHFNKKVPTGRGRFLKKIRMKCMQRNGRFFLFCFVCKFCM